MPARQAKKKILDSKGVFFMGRNKKWNLKKQMFNLIEKSCVFGADKHSDKRNGTNHTKIYSYNDRKDLIDVSANFCNWIKANDLDIKNITDIKAEHVQRFLDEKAQTCTNSTLKTYTSRFHKLDRIFEQNISAYERKLESELIKPVAVNETKLRSVAMDRQSDFKKLLDTAYQPRRAETTRVAIEVSSRAGLRVSEVAKLKGTDYDANRGVLRVVDSKGKLTREVEIKDEDKPYFEGLKAQYGNGRVCPIKSDSINQNINRCMRAAGLGEFIEHKTNVHAIRKMVAQERYDELKELGYSNKDAWEQVSDYLGHGEDRWELYKAYITKP